MMIRSKSVITVWLIAQTAGMLLLVPVLNAQSKPIGPAPAATSTQSSEAEQNGGDVFKDLQKKVTEGPAPLSEAQIASASEFGRQLGAVDWLGPLAPIALSPFFGMACLSGLANWGPTWISDHPLLTSPVLKNPNVFFVFFVLTLVTSLPRLTKVSKPVAQALDRLEAYATIITLVAIRFLAPSVSDTPETAMHTDMPVLQAGVFAFSADVLFSLAAALNILVINTIKFFCEVLVWLTPVPLIDAFFELANKSLCAGLMAIYAFSPTLATIINLAFFTVCLLMFRWVARRVRFYRTLMADPLLRRIWKSRRPERIPVFPKTTVGAIPPKALAYMQRSGDGWRLHCVQWWMFSRTAEIHAKDYRIQLKRGFLSSTLQVEGRETFSLITPWRSEAEARELAAQFGFELVESTEPENQRQTVRAEWA